MKIRSACLLASICCLSLPCQAAQASSDATVLGETSHFSSAKPKFDHDRGVVAYVLKAQRGAELVLQDYRDRSILYRLAVDREVPLTLSLSAGAERVAYVSDSDALLVRDTRTGTLLLRRELRSLGFRFVPDEDASSGITIRKQKLLFSRDGKHLAVLQSAYQCGHSDRLALIDLEKNELHPRPSGRMTGDMAFDPASSRLFVFDLCDDASGTISAWSTSQPSKYEPFGKFASGIKAAFIPESSGQAFVLSNGEREDRSTRPLHSVSTRTGEVLWRSSDELYPNEKLLRVSPDGTHVLANSRSGLVHMVGTQPFVMETYPDFSGVYASRDWKSFAGYRAYSRKLEIWDGSSLSLKATLDLSAVAPSGASEVLDIQLLPGTGKTRIFSLETNGGSTLLKMSSIDTP